MASQNDGILQICLYKKRDCYIFRYRAGEEDVLIGDLIAKAYDPRCALDWFDVAVLSHEISERIARRLQEKLKNFLGAQ